MTYQSWVTKLKREHLKRQGHCQDIRCRREFYDKLEMQVNHLVRKGQSGPLRMEEENIRIACADHGSPEDSDEARGSVEIQVEILRERYGDERADYAKRELQKAGKWNV